MLLDLFDQISRLLNTRVRLHIEDSWADIQENAQNREIDGLAFDGRDSRRYAHYNATDIVLIVAWMSYDHWRNEKLQGTIGNILWIDEYPIEMVTYIRKDWP